MDNIIRKIKSKKPLDRLDDEFVASYLNEFLRINPKLKKNLDDGVLKKREERGIIKGVRSELNRVYGQFWLDDRMTLDSHKSTKERKSFYEDLYKKILLITGKPRTILDLGCGLNPLTYNLIGRDVYFIATELTNYDCSRLRKYFNDNNVKGEVVRADLREYNKFPKVGVCFMFKFLDSIEIKGHKLSEYLVSTIKADYIVASFSTETMSGRRMNYPRRGWFEMMLKRLGYGYEKFCFGKEVFYVVKKQLA